MKTYKIFRPDKIYNVLGGFDSLLTVKGDFIYAQPSGVSTIHLLHDADSKSDIVAVVPANLLILEV